MEMRVLPLMHLQAVLTQAFCASGAAYTVTTSSQQASSLLQAIYSAGHRLVLFSNQSLIKAVPNEQHQQDFQHKLASIMSRLGVPATAFIATLRDGNRKPRLGMWSLFTNEYNGHEPVDLMRSFYVGDAAGRPGDHSADDANFARAIGLPFLLPEQVFGIAE